MDRDRGRDRRASCPSPKDTANRSGEAQEEAAHQNVAVGDPRQFTRMLRNDFTAAELEVEPYEIQQFLLEQANANIPNAKGDGNLTSTAPTVIDLPHLPTSKDSAQGRSEDQRNKRKLENNQMSDETQQEGDKRGMAKVKTLLPVWVANDPAWKNDNQALNQTDTPQDVFMGHNQPIQVNAQNSNDVSQMSIGYSCLDDDLDSKDFADKDGKLYRFSRNIQRPSIGQAVDGPEPCRDCYHTEKNGCPGEGFCWRWQLGVGSSYSDDSDDDLNSLDSMDVIPNEDGTFYQCLPRKSIITLRNIRLPWARHHPQPCVDCSSRGAEHCPGESFCQYWKPVVPSSEVADLVVSSIETTDYGPCTFCCIHGTDCNGQRPCQHCPAVNNLFLCCIQKLSSEEMDDEFIRKWPTSGHAKRIRNERGWNPVVASGNTDSLPPGNVSSSQLSRQMDVSPEKLHLRGGQGPEEDSELEESNAEDRSPSNLRLRGGQGSEKDSEQEESAAERRLRNSNKELFPHSIHSFASITTEHEEEEISDFECADPANNFLSTNSHYVTESITNQPGHRSDTRGDGGVTWLGGGESYRPSARPRSPRAGTFRSDRDRDQSPRRERARTPPRDRARTPVRERARTPPPASDSYYPSARDRSPRRRSRTPPYRPRERTPPRDVSNWRARERARSPPRTRSPPRRFSPRRDDDRRERPRSPRRRSRSPYDRSRPMIRVRSPVRSPPACPRRGRSRTPDRRDTRAPTGPSSTTWRRQRSPSPGRDSERSSGRTSGDNSRRSSPPVHPSRIPLSESASRDERPIIQSPPSRDRSPPGQHTNLPHRDSGRDSTRSTPIERSPARPVAPRSPPRGPAGFRPPTGPSGGRNFTTPMRSPISGPASATQVTISAHSRPEPVAAVPPTGPRAQARGPSYMRGGRGSFSGDRSLRPDTTSWGSAPSSRPAIETPSRGGATVSRAGSIASPPASAPTGPSGIPTGPRAGTITSSRPSLQPASSVYPRQQFNAVPQQPRGHPAMANITPIIPGGRIDPTASGIPADIEARLKKRREEEEILREDLQQKQEKLRRGLKQWDKLSRDSHSWALKSELSERHVRTLAGEGVGGAAF